MVRQEAWWSRGDGSQLVFGDTVVESGLDGGPGVLDGCWWVVRVTEQVFDELLCVVAKSSSGLEDEWGQVDAGVPVELFLLFTFSHVAWAGAGCGYESSIGGERCDNRPPCQCSTCCLVGRRQHPCELLPPAHQVG